MSCPLFLIGPARSGTTFAERLLRMSPGVCSDRYVPFDRWDFVAAMEVGGNTSQTPQMAKALAWAGSKPELYALIRLALPWAYASLGWRYVWQHAPAAYVVTIARNWFDTWSSWLDMPHRLRVNRPAQQTAYSDWHGTLVDGFKHEVRQSPKHCSFIAYEQLLNDPGHTVVEVCDSLGVPAPTEDLMPFVRKPANWSEAFANWWQEEQNDSPA